MTQVVGFRRRPDIQVSVPVRPLGKPRMTQRDRWKKRPCVLQYRAYCDRLRQDVTAPDPHATELIAITAYFRPPSSWSRRKRLAAIGTKYRSKPDPDNIEKGVLDALFPDDAAVGDVFVSRWYAEADALLLCFWMTCATKKPTKRRRHAESHNE